MLVEEEGSTQRADNDSDSDEARVLSPLQAAACTYGIALGPRADQKMLVVQGAMPREKDFKQRFCADIDGFSLHAAVWPGRAKAEFKLTAVNQSSKEGRRVKL